jgi:hypothetical protein
VSPPDFDTEEEQIELPCDGFSSGWEMPLSEDVAEKRETTSYNKPCHPVYARQYTDEESWWLRPKKYKIQLHHLNTSLGRR